MGQGQRGNLHFAVLGLVSRQPDGIHPYGLKNQFKALSDDFWELNYGTLYRILGQLEKAGDLSSTDVHQTGKPSRRVYRITEQGIESFGDWLLNPLDEEARPLRDELSLKLLFMEVSQVEDVLRLISEQRAIYLKKLHWIRKRKTLLTSAGLGGQFLGFVIDGAEKRVRADLLWLENVERKVFCSR